MTSQLFFLSLADIFSVYPQLFEELIATKAKPTHILLPSDWSWREKVYTRLLEIQKRINDAIEGGMTFEDVTKRKDALVFDLRALREPHMTQRRCLLNQKFYTEHSVYWSLDNIAKAAKLLKKPPLAVQFKNEHEMRRVYSLIYDVFRYKMVLANALNDIDFYRTNPEHAKDANRICLMLYELFQRHFKARPSEEHAEQTVLYREAAVWDISQCLWKLRVRLAGSLSRMRIKYGALNLSQLLPIHLQNEKVAMAASNPIVTGWINPFLMGNRTAAESFLSQMGFQLLQENSGGGESDAAQLQVNQYKWDTVCPLFLSCIPQDRSEFTKSKLISKHLFVLQDKTFSFGPAVMSKLLEHYDVDGDILQTHISSPRATAYLASLFHSINRVNNFYVYGAGPNLREYRNYMDALGITNIRIFGESYTTFPLESNRFATVVGIFANPPNSFSAISDPIDLICSRGGDLSMLEVLTETEISDDGKRRVSLILEEQLFTLQMCMSRSHTQFVMYQTHSIVQSENEAMVRHMVRLINAVSLEKHKAAFRERKRLQALVEAELANLPAAAMASGGANSPRKRETDASGEPLPEETEDSVQLPEMDEFVFEEHIPDICLNQDNCLMAQSNGCYFALVRRKSITRHNAKYLIKMAEMRGLFGGADGGGKTARSKFVKPAETHQDKANEANLLAKGRPMKASTAEAVLARLQHATNASFIRSHLDALSQQQQQPLTFNCKGRACKRYACAIMHNKLWHPTQIIKYWWQSAFKSVQYERAASTLAAAAAHRKQHGDCKYAHVRSRHLHGKLLAIFKRKPLPVHITEIKMFEYCVRR